AVGGGGAGTGGFTGAVEDIPVPPEPGECETIDIRARADASGAPYIVPANAFELYQMFEFEIPLGGTAQALSFEPLIDNTKVIHHWLLYQSNGVVVNGRNYTALGVHGDSFLVAGWAPGTGPWYLPKHVGVDLGAGKFILEVHYNNPGGGPEPDSSGVRVCKTNNLRPQTASVSWLGNDLFGINPLSTVEVAGRCRPVNQTEPIHILRTWPHMHLMGRRMRVVIDRAGGGQDVVHDQPFDFNNQIQYDTPTILNPGDSILTTCYFDNTSPNFITFGEATTQEMCFNFTVAYPANKLVQQTLHNNSCISLP
ncbi:MAG: hypothetical protein FJ104_17055, partial [Deltaproteobacteria bacterium]|nr:hypothetical protein [Deltaproteobacteria bacterium]